MGLWEVRKRYAWSPSDLIFDLCSRYDVFIYVTLGNILRSKMFIKKLENIKSLKKYYPQSHFLEIITVVSSYQLFPPFLVLQKAKIYFLGDILSAVSMQKHSERVSCSLWTGGEWHKVLQVWFLFYSCIGRAFFPQKPQWWNPLCLEYILT